MYYFLPFFFVIIAPLLSWKTTFSLISYPCHFRNIINQKLYEINLLIPISYTYVDLLILIFCFNNFQCMIPYPIDMSPPVWILMISCTPYAASIQVKTLENFLDPFTRLTSIVFFTHTKHLFRFFQSFLSLLDTPLLKKNTNIYGSGHALFYRYNNLAAMEWKISLLSSSNFSDFFNIQIWCCSSEYTLSLISSPKFSIALSRYSFMFVLNFFYSVISVFIPGKDCSVPLVITRSPKCTLK